MKYRWMLAVMILAVGQFGCECENTVDRDLKPKGAINDANGPVNTAMVQTMNNQMVDNAIIREHSLYPYHFVVNSAEFNELGWRDLHVLANHYGRYPGPLNVRQGDTPDDLYKARVKAVVDAMTHNGVHMDRIKVTDGMPGGDGITADQVVIITERQKAQAGAAASEKTNAKADSSMSKQPTGTPQSTGVGSSGGSSSGGQY
jgi:hypothetical protein